jgi:hypothetical protein
MAAFALIGPLISGLASVAGGLISMSAANSQANAEEAMAASNAARQREQAALAQSKGAADAAETERKGRRQAALARATMAQGGAATDTGTPLLLEQEFASETAWRANMQMANAKNEQSNLMNKAAAQEFEGQIRANASRASGTAALLSGFAGAAKSLGGSKFG